jgi:hypothetical protein
MFNSPNSALPNLLSPEISAQFFYALDARIWIPGKCYSKLRPRTNFKTKTVHLDANYKQWKNSTQLAIQQAITYWENLDYVPKFNPNLVQTNLNCYYQFPLTCAEICVLFVGNHAGDPDNRYAALIDVLVGIAIANDTATYTPHGRYESQRFKTNGALIVIQPAQQKTFDWNQISTWF